MTALPQDIRFACANCGQRIVVDASAAGVETACPGCEGPVVIPEDGMLVGREIVAAVAPRGNGTGRTGLPDGAARTEPLERELAASRKEVARLKERLRVLGDERAQLQAEIADAAKKGEQAAEDLELARERGTALEAEASAMQARRTVAENELSETRAEIVRLEEESAARLRNFDETRRKLVAAEAEARRAGELERESQSVQGKLTSALEDGRRGEQRCKELRAEVESARRELQQTESGRALTALRVRFAQTEEERQRLAAQFSEAQGEVRRLAEGAREWRTQFDTMRRQRDEALSRADAGSHSALQHGNDVLRGILDRQKSELDERYTELRRLRAAQLSLRILYVLTALLLFVAIVLGLQTLHGMWR